MGDARFGVAVSSSFVRLSQGAIEDTNEVPQKSPWTSKSSEISFLGLFMQSDTQMLTSASGVFLYLFSADTERT